MNKLAILGGVIVAIMGTVFGERDPTATYPVILIMGGVIIAMIGIIARSGRKHVD